MDPQVPNTIVPQTPQIPQTERDNHWISILAMAIFVLFSLGVVAFLYYQNQQLKSMLANYQTPAASPTPTATPDVTADWKTYTDKNNLFSFKYPSLWKLKEFNSESRIVVSDNINNSLQLIYGLKSPDRLSATPEQIVDDWVNYYLDSTSQFETGGKISSKEKIEIGGLQGTRYVVEEKKPLIQDTRERSWIFIINNSKVIYLDVDGPDSEILDQILSTFKFLGQGDEVLGIQTNTCCSCPTKVSKSAIGTNGWVLYEKGKDYSGLLPAMCKAPNIGVCAPCPPLEE